MPRQREQPLQIQAISCRGVESKSFTYIQIQFTTMPRRCRRQFAGKRTRSPGNNCCRLEVFAELPASRHSFQSPLATHLGYWRTHLRSKTHVRRPVQLHNPIPVQLFSGPNPVRFCTPSFQKLFVGFPDWREIWHLTKFLCYQRSSEADFCIRVLKSSKNPLMIINCKKL